MCGFPVINGVLVLLLILLNASLKAVVSSEAPEDPTGWSNSKFSIEEDLFDPTGWNDDRTTKRDIGERENMFAYCDSLLKGRSENPPVENNNEGRPLQHGFKSFHDSKSNIAFVRRFISLLLESANLNNQNNVNQGVLHGLLEIKMKVEQYERLLQFIQSRENISFRELDSILSNTINGRNAADEPFLGGLVDKMLYLVSLTEHILPLTFFLIALYLVRLIIVSKSISRSFLSLFLVIFFVAYLFEYYRRCKDIEIEQMVMLGRHANLPPSCSAEQNLWGRILSLFQSQDDCAEYHKAVLINPLYKVSPLGVLSCTFASMFTEPARMVASAIAGFSREILGTLPFAYGWFVYLVSILVILGIIAMLCGGSLRLGNFFGSVTISSKTPLIASTVREALTSGASAPPSASDPLPQVSSVNGSGNYILMEAKALKSLLAADKMAPADRIQELDRHIVRSKSVPDTLVERSGLNESTKESDSFPPHKETDRESEEINEDVVHTKEKQKSDVLSKSQSYHGKSSCQKVTSDEADDLVLKKNEELEELLKQITNTK